MTKQILLHPSSNKKLHYLLQDLSDICYTAKTTHKAPHANILADTIRNHVIIPFRRYLYTTTNDATNATPLQTQSEYHQITTIILRSLNICFPIIRGTLTLIPFSQVCDHFYNLLFGLHDSSPTYKTVRQIWEDLFSLLKESLFLWLSQARIHDIHSQFFISDQHANLQVIEDRLPNFISLQVAQNILFAGNAKKCVMLLHDEMNKQQQTSLSLQNLTHHHDDCNVDSVSSEPLLVALSFEAASIRWKNSSSNLLSKLLPFDSVRNRVYQLRQFLLQGDALFWRSFFEQLEQHKSLRFRSGLKEEERNVITRILNNIFHSLWIDQLDKSSNTTHQNVPFEFQLTESGHLFPIFALSYAESQLLSPRAHVYCDVFPITFNMRRVACHLQSAFAHLYLMQRNHRLTLSSLLHGSINPWVRLREIRRRMDIFVQSFESYIQEQVIEPQFLELFDLFDHRSSYIQHEDHSLDNIKSKEPFFDVLLSAHNRLLDKVFAGCFVREQQIGRLIHSALEACLELCELIPTLKIEQDTPFTLPEKVNAIERDFVRNVDLLSRILLHRQTENPDFRITDFLQRIESITVVNVNSG